VSSNAPTYLKEPTAEFKDELARVEAFNKYQAKVRSRWDAIIAKFEASSTPEELEANLKAMNALLVEIQSVPTGVKLPQLVKTCRLKKFADKKGRKRKEEWTTKVEIAYQALILEFNREISPNNKVDKPLF
jgi:hypothetical protein